MSGLSGFTSSVGVVFSDGPHKAVNLFPARETSLIRFVLCTDIHSLGQRGWNTTATGGGRFGVRLHFIEFFIVIQLNIGNGMKQTLGIGWRGSSKIEYTSQFRRHAPHTSQRPVTKLSEESDVVRDDSSVREFLHGCPGN